MSAPAVQCLPHRQWACLLCHPEPVAAVAERRPNVWLKDGDGWVRHDADGTEWTIERAVAGGVDLVLVYREHRLRSHHANATAAKKHRTDMVAAWQAQTVHQWIAGRR